MSKTKIISTESAIIPTEEASQPLSFNDAASSNPSQDKSQRQITFSSDSKIGDTQSSQSSVYKACLSQPLCSSHRERLLWLQKRRTEGLWVLCDSCSRWRYMPHVIDHYELPDKWYCNMNPDKNMADCSVPETPIQLHDEEDLIHSRFSAGSIVWVKMQGWPWWPAMVDDCPDTEQFYWLDGFSDIPTDYHVVFFDKLDVTRAWVRDRLIVPYSIDDKNKIKQANQSKKYAKRLQAAMRQATEALSLPLASRFSKYSFIARYKGKILSPTKLSKAKIEKFRESLKRKFDVDFPLSSDSDDSSSEDESYYKINTNSANKNKVKVTENKKTTAEKSESDQTLANCTVSSTTMIEQNKDKDILKEPNSLNVNVNTADDSLANATLDNGPSFINANEGMNSKGTEVFGSQLEVRATSRGSDEFEF